MKQTTTFFIAVLALLLTGCTTYAQTVSQAIPIAPASEWTETAMDSGKLQVVRDITDRAAGSVASLRLQSTGGAASGNVHTALAGVAGKTLSVSGQVRGTGDLKEAQVAVFAQDAQYKMILWKMVATKSLFTGDWKSFKETVTIPGEAKNVLLILFLNGDGKVWLDNVAVTDTAQDKPTTAPRPRGPLSPVVESVSTVAPDMVELVIREGRIMRGNVAPYEKKVGDTTQEEKNKEGVITKMVLVRGGKSVGNIIGPKRDYLTTWEGFEGDELQGEYAGAATTYSLTSISDPNYAQPVRPLAVYRKSKPIDWQTPQREHFVMRHRVYLRLPKPLQRGATYTIGLSDLNVQQTTALLVYDPSAVQSEAVHVSQIGYRPDEPTKCAYLSLWLGTGGAMRYPDALPFTVIDTRTSAVVYEGKATVAKATTDTEDMFRKENFNKTNVYHMDFGGLVRPGTYRVSVDGVGCSYPFVIGNGVWERAFVTQMRGLLNERSGVTLGSPFTNFRKPRDFNPADGVSVTQSTYTIMDGPGENPELAKRDTHVPVPNAWGGYHDAGDWNPRRVTHMAVTMAQLELLELFPDYFGKLTWNIPHKPNVPDILTEALFEADLFRRLQKPDGGVPFGIETDGDPREGEVSWLQTMPAYVYGPDIWSTYVYTGVAARTARLLTAYDPALAQIYRLSALKAMQWAEADYAKRKVAGTVDKLRWEARDSRNLAALELFKLTNDKRWHDVFRENSVLGDANAKIFAYGDHVQRDAAFIYARLPQAKADPAMQANARRAVLQQADAALQYANGNAWGITTPDKGKPMFLGFYSTPDAIEVVRAYYLTDDKKYLAGAVQACQFASGANPNNLTYTTGVGANPIQHPLHIDSRLSGQAAPEGLTAYGNFDFVGWPQQDWALWPLKYYLGKICVPSAYEWPIPEAYWDIYLYPAIDEFTVDAWTPNVYVWGYLAARKARTD